jgi:hypothetical protein
MQNHGRGQKEIELEMGMLSKWPSSPQEREGRLNMGRKGGARRKMSSGFQGNFGKGSNALGGLQNGSQTEQRNEGEFKRCGFGISSHIIFYER